MSEPNPEEVVRLAVDPESCVHPAFAGDRSWRAERGVEGFLTLLLSLFAGGWIAGAFLSVLLSKVGFLISLVLAPFVAYFVIRVRKYPLVCSSCGRQKSTSGMGSWNPVGIDRIPLVAPPARQHAPRLQGREWRQAGRQEGWHPDPVKS
jgi:hypothetical protein